MYSTKSEPYVKYALPMIMMCPCKSISCNKGTFGGGGGEGDADNRRGCTCVGAGSVWEISVPSPPFCMNQTAIKKLKIAKNKNVLDEKFSSLQMAEESENLKTGK